MTDDSLESAPLGPSRARLPPTDPAHRIEDERLRGEIKVQLFGERPSVVRIGQYTVLEVLGAGGMGLVYGVYDPRLDRRGG